MTKIYIFVQHTCAHSLFGGFTVKLPPVKVSIFLFVVLGLGYGLIAKHLPAAVHGNVTVGHLYLIIVILAFLALPHFYRGRIFLSWLDR